MYRLEIKGRNLDEFKKAVLDINNVVQSGNILCKTTEVDNVVIDQACTRIAEATLPSTLNEAPVLPTLEVPPTSTPIVIDTELDTEGLPWDARINSSSREKVKNGTWKKRRGTDVATVQQVKAELLNNSTQPAPVVETPPVAEAPAPSPTLPSINGHTLDTFKLNFAMILGTLISEGKINQDYVNTLKTHFNVAEIWQVDDTQKEEMFESFVQYNLITKAM